MIFFSTQKYWPLGVFCNSTVLSHCWASAVFCSLVGLLSIWHFFASVVFKMSFNLYKRKQHRNCVCGCYILQYYISVFLSWYPISYDEEASKRQKYQKGTLNQSFFKFTISSIYVNEGFQCERIHNHAQFATILASLTTYHVLNLQIVHHNKYKIYFKWLNKHTSSTNF